MATLLLLCGSRVAVTVGDQNGAANVTVIERLWKS